MPEGGKKTEFEPGVIARLVQGVRYAISGQKPDDFFGPGQPMQPVAQEAAQGRQFDFPAFINTVPRPRAQEGVSFEQMRALADSYDLMRLVIETRKDQLLSQKWNVRLKDPKAPRTPRCDEIEAFLQSPDKEHTWSSWLRMLLEDLFVLDAPTIYPRMTRGGDLYALELIDGATIKRVLDATGRTPAAPDPAYQQVIKGLPAVDYSRDELIYVPRNPRTSRVYGYSPVEQVIMTVNIAMRRQIHQLQYYTEGNIPEAMIGVPDTWQPDQIKSFQDWWDSVMEGNTAKRRKAIFVPGGMDPTFTKDGVLKDEADEWFARIVCFAFSISPAPFIKSMNRATAESAQEAALEEGLAPLMKWVEDTMNYIIARWLQAPEVVFDWERKADTDPLAQAQIDKLYLDAGALHPDEVREALGREPLTEQQKADITPPPPPGLSVGPDGKPLPGKPPVPGAPKADPADKVEKKKHFTPSTQIAKHLTATGHGFARY